MKDRKAAGVSSMTEQTKHILTRPLWERNAGSILVKSNNKKNPGRVAENQSTGKVKRITRL